ncbi:MAG TPA: ABC transporter substrate-binding protein [Pseudonocardiaceae bacterium]|nr:ABC transporter substrate-binding protein [Pseudonocardiaceae bacterium]
MRRRLLLSIIPVLAVAAACTGTPTPSASGRPDNTAMVLAEPMEPVSLNPLDGYAPNGAAKIFDGLYEYQADGTLRPALASALPVSSADGRSWTVSVRGGISFSDSTPFAVTDVLATYRALLDSRYASPLRSDYSMLSSVTEVNDSTVRFNLAYPYAPFPDKLVLGIVPATALTTVEPVTKLPMDTDPVGTGPYTLVSWTKGDRLVLAANPRYPTALGGPPKVKKVTVVFVPGDQDRVTRLRAGKLDGAAVSPAQAAGFLRSNAFTVLTDHSADLRAISLPVHGPVTGDPAIRLALNEAVDRRALVTGPLKGTGSPAATPMPAVLPEFVEPSATFKLDQEQARTELLAGGWVANTGGGRRKHGVPAAFTLAYPAGDTVDAALATAFVADAKAIGVTVTPEAVPRSELAEHLDTDATLISAGNPFDPDLDLYPLLSTAMAGADSAITSALNTGRRTLDPAQRAVAYRQFQKAYLSAPTMVCLVFLDHTYVMRNNWNGYAPVTDSASQGVTWGPWWNLAQWTPR